MSDEDWNIRKYIDFLRLCRTHSLRGSRKAQR